MPKKEQQTLQQIIDRLPVDFRPQAIAALQEGVRWSVVPDSTQLLTLQGDPMGNISLHNSAPNLLVNMFCARIGMQLEDDIPQLFVTLITPVGFSTDEVEKLSPL